MQNHAGCRRLAAVTLLLLFVVPVKADSEDPFASGATLLPACKDALMVAEGSERTLTSTELRRGLLCTGYIRGFLDGHDVTAAFLAVKAYGGKVTAAQVKRSSLICPPASATAAQAIKAVIRYLEQNPESQHVAARLLVGGALQETYPCP
jgi:hypothetical protein